MKNSYVDVMLQSLKKKLEVLEAIETQNLKQKAILEDEMSSVDDFDETVAAKDRLLEQLEQLDSGFEKLYERVKQELEADKEAYAESIREMQGYIRLLTEKSMDLQKQEATNKNLFINRSSLVKKQAKSVRANAKATSEYYRNMMNSDYIDPQFMDNKK